MPHNVSIGRSHHVFVPMIMLMMKSLFAHFSTEKYYHLLSVAVYRETFSVFLLSLWHHGSFIEFIEKVLSKDGIMNYQSFSPRICGRPKMRKHWHSAQYIPSTKNLLNRSPGFVENGGMINGRSWFLDLVHTYCSEAIRSYTLLSMKIWNRLSDVNLVPIA